MIGSMTAVSGSPTQIAASVATPQDLAGLPDDAFKAGDLAYVASLAPNGTFRLVRTALVGDADNITTIDTRSGNGYWDLFAQTGNLWAAETDWFIDAVNGQDYNLGTSQAAPLKTFAEWRARLITANVPYACEIHVLSDIPASDRPTFEGMPVGSSVSVVGETTVLGTGEITAVQAINGAANQALEIEALALGGSWTALGYVGMFIRITTAGPRFGAIAAVVKDLGGGNNRARLMPMAIPQATLSGSATSVVPLVGDTFEVLDLAHKIGTHPCVSGIPWDSEVGFRYLDLEEPTYSYDYGNAISGTAFLTVCRVRDYLQVLGDGLMRATLSLFRGSAGPNVYSLPEIYDSAHGEFRYCAFVHANAWVSAYSPNARVTVQDNTIFQDGAVIFTRRGGEIVVNNVATFDSMWVLLILKAGATGHALARIYGSGNTNNVVVVGSGSKFLYTTLASLTATSTAQVVNFGGTLRDWSGAGGLPYVNTGGNQGMGILTG